MAYKRELIAKTKNLFNLATASVGYIDWQGNLNHSEDTITYGLSSDYLECTPNTSYTISAFCGKHPLTNDSTLWCRIAYYDENKQLLTSPSKFFTDTNIDYISATWSAPTNAKYLRATTRWMSPTYREQHPENWVMLEKGSEATEYVPYGHLSSYKKLLKVSDVCQLLDKSKYPATGTYDGVIYTNNGDGTITLNGTATANTNYNLQWNISVIEGHKYLPFFYNTNIGQPYLLLYSNDTEVFDKRFPGASGSVVTCLKTYNAVYYQIKVSTGTSVSNLITKPQLFDLTEMFGSGNEPKTVAEFKQKFPDELYPYSPNCWITSYKTGLIAKTKNLFDISKVNTTTTLNVVDNTISAKNTSSDPLPWTYNNSQYKTTLDAGRYFLSFDNMSMASSVNESTQLLVRDDTNTWVAQITDKAFVNNKVVTSFTLDKQTNIGIQLKLYTQVISNFQIEKGSEATNYVPYGYL